MNNHRSRIAAFGVLVGVCGPVCAAPAEFPPVAPIAAPVEVPAKDASSDTPNAEVKPAAEVKATGERVAQEGTEAVAGVEPSAPEATAAKPPAQPASGKAPASTFPQQASLAPPPPPPPSKEAGVTPVVDLKVEPGVNEIIPVALGHLNRIVTPFAEPELRTTSDAETTIRGGVIYVAPKSEMPVTFFVTPKGEESVALSLTLAPRRIPPREIRLAIADKWMAKTDTPSQQASKWENEHPYVNVITAALRESALGVLPQGYSLRPLTGGVVPRCVAPAASAVAYSFERGQLIQGSSLRVLVGMVSNTGTLPVELQEQWCWDTGVAAVAYWPRIVLAPGERSEVYVAMRIEAPRGQRSTRPSLVN